MKIKIDELHEEKFLTKDELVSGKFYRSNNESRLGYLTVSRQKDVVFLVANAGQVIYINERAGEIGVSTKDLGRSFFEAPKTSVTLTSK